MSKIRRAAVLDVDGDFRRMVADFLKGKGYDEVLETQDSQEVLDRHLADPFQLIVVEWEIPDLGGDIFLRKIARHNGRKCRIVVVLDGSNSVHIETKVGGYLLKPVSLNDLEKILGEP